MGLLDGQVVFITGGARGQGRAHAVTSAREGADVILLDVPHPVGVITYETATVEDLEETVRLVEREGRRAVAVVGDVRSQADIDSAVSQGLAAFGRIDSLIANAGIWNGANCWEISEELWQTTMDINVGGVFRSVKAVAPHMRERGSGSIIIVSSINGTEAGPTYAQYAASKHAVLGFMKSVSLELGTSGIRVNALCPGPTLTPMINHQAAWDLWAGGPGLGTPEIMSTTGYDWFALKGINWLSPQAQADAALFLNSAMASCITGIALPVEGGHLNLPGLNPTPTA